LTAFFSTLPKELEDSALIDGCSLYQAFWRIMLPLAQPGIITVGIFNFMAIWNEYFMALIFANKTELRTLAVGLQFTIQSMRYVGDWAGLFAAVIIVFLPTFILYILLSQKIIAGITGGAIKG
jgi:N-acetylglucosamine transport system permease protein